MVKKYSTLLFSFLVCFVFVFLTITNILQGATFLFPYQGGTGTTTTPGDGQFFLGGNTGQYHLVRFIEGTNITLSTTTNSVTISSSGITELTPDWFVNTAGDSLRPTTTLGIIISSSSTIESLQIQDALRASSTLTVQGLSTFAGFISTASSTINGHLQIGQGVAPSLSSCGTNPEIYGSDNTGNVIIGTGVVSSCTITFGTNFDNPPHCFANDGSAILLIRASSTVSTLVLSVATTFQGDYVDYWCIPH